MCTGPESIGINVFVHKLLFNRHSQMLWIHLEFNSAAGEEFFFPHTSQAVQVKIRLLFLSTCGNAENISHWAEC